MSAYIVSRDTMHAVVTSIIDHHDQWYNTDTYRSWNPGDPMPAAEFWGASLITAGTRIGRALFRLNNRAMGARYSEGPDPIAASYVFVPMPRLDPFQKLKCIECLTYQCMEGVIPETSLFRALERAGLEQARSIAISLPQYEAASWGLD